MRDERKPLLCCCEVLRRAKRLTQSNSQLTSGRVFGKHESMSHESSYESGQQFSKFKMADVVKSVNSVVRYATIFCFSNSFQ